MSEYHNLEHWLSWVDELSNRDYVIIDGFLSHHFQQEIKTFLLSKLPHFSLAGIGALDQHAVHQEIRGDRTYWLDRQRDTDLDRFWGLVDETMAIFNRYCFLSLSGYEFHLANYPPGGHYDKHLDQFQNRNNRMISMIIYLNEEWKKGDGGELEIFESNEQSVLVEPIAGRCVMFKSATVPHAVLESNRHRYSLTGWLLYQPSALGQFFG